MKLVYNVVLKNYL